MTDITYHAAFLRGEWQVLMYCEHEPVNLDDPECVEVRDPYYTYVGTCDGQPHAEAEAASLNTTGKLTTDQPFRIVGGTDR